jgi:hypothetical protein
MSCRFVEVRIKSQQCDSIGDDGGYRMFDHTRHKNEPFEWILGSPDVLPDIVDRCIRPIHEGSPTLPAISPNSGSGEGVIRLGRLGHSPKSVVEIEILPLPEIVWVTDPTCAMLWPSKGGRERCATWSSTRQSWASPHRGR